MGKFRKYSSTTIADGESDFQEQDVSLRNLMKAVKAEGKLNAKLNQDISDLRQEVHSASVSVTSQVKKVEN